MISTVTLNPALDVTLEVDDLHLNQYNQVNNASIYPGGKGINVSKVVRACGRETIAIGFFRGRQRKNYRGRSKKTRYYYKLLAY